jgi:hypothetical protein
VEISSPGFLCLIVYHHPVPVRTTPQEARLWSSLSPPSDTG